ncbi:hypothetical protein BDV96DRAFT_642864 [Lophiotrema nucula]|uniref:Uncharacterized protein n=1 Tax=Lophiotrema nucula TaxID=690887 RepID=A0A6A5ZIK4_9PLEO|nr:hypothetical protein BDV96DRAFT_642864 [Lophiotrema nucula]
MFGSTKQVGTTGPGHFGHPAEPRVIYRYQEPDPFDTAAQEERNGLITQYLLCYALVLYLLYLLFTRFVPYVRNDLLPQFAIVIDNLFQQNDPVPENIMAKLRAKLTPPIESTLTTAPPPPPPNTYTDIWGVTRTYTEEEIARMNFRQRVNAGVIKSMTRAEYEATYPMAPKSQPWPWETAAEDRRQRRRQQLQEQFHQQQKAEQIKRAKEAEALRRAEAVREAEQRNKDTAPEEVRPSQKNDADHNEQPPVQFEIKPTETSWNRLDEIIEQKEKHTRRFQAQMQELLAENARLRAGYKTATGEDWVDEEIAREEQHQQQQPAPMEPPMAPEALQPPPTTTSFPSGAPLMGSTSTTTIAVVTPAPVAPKPSPPPVAEEPPAAPEALQPLPTTTSFAWGAPLTGSTSNPFNGFAAPAPPSPKPSPTPVVEEEDDGFEAAMMEEMEALGMTQQGVVGEPAKKTKTAVKSRKSRFSYDPFKKMGGRR